MAGLPLENRLPEHGGGWGVAVTPAGGTTGRPAAAAVRRTRAAGRFFPPPSRDIAAAAGGLNNCLYPIADSTLTVLCLSRRGSQDGSCV